MRWRRINRSPVVFWAVAVVLSGLTATAVWRAVGSAQAEAARYGSLRKAVVARRALAAGEVLAEGDVEVKTIPAAFLPRGFLSALPRGRTLVVPLFPGQAVVEAHLAPEGLSGVSALLPAGARAVAVPTGRARPPVRRGDLVDLLATFATDKSKAQEPTVEVARTAPVLDVTDETVTVAVSPDEAKRVAFALVGGSVTLTVTSPMAAGADEG